ncbi:MAG: hypothetical protein ACR2H2_19950 [Solirubrobacteraceae bacterium]
MSPEPITYMGRVVAAATAERFLLSDELEHRPVGDPERTFVIYMCLYARDIATGDLPGPYTEQRARRFARACLIPAELTERASLDTARAAAALGVPEHELHAARRVPPAMTDATHRAVRDVLNHGLHGDLIASVVGVELGAQLQSAITSDTGDGATPGDILQALRDACDQDPVAYARLLELIVLAAVDELQVIAGPPGGPERAGPDVPPPPRRRSARRRR